MERFEILKDIITFHEIFQNLNSFRHVWNIWGWKNAFQHDSFFCKKFNTSVVRGWPTQRRMERNNFVAAVVKDKRHSIIKVKCPVECRRKKEWEYC